MAASSRSPSAADRNLLFGILALQMDFINRDQLVAAMNAWVLDKAKPLGQILLEQKSLAAGDRALLEPLVDRHVAQHGGPEKSLAALGQTSSLEQSLAGVKDNDVEASLARLQPTAASLSSGTLDWRSARPGYSGPRFRVLRPHARGGLGEVFVAEDQELHREVALKEIQNQHADEPVSRTRFLMEAEITGGLEHPGIVPVYGLGSYADGRPYYAMRFIRGDSLKEAIAQFHANPSGTHDSLALRQLLRRFTDVCNAMSYAHSRGVLHRDLKPGNIMLGKYGETLVVDWGLAKSIAAGFEPQASEPGSGAAGVNIDSETPLKLASGSNVDATQMGSAIGTPGYMSPEQAAGRLDELSPASDVYSLGATLYMLLVGKSAFSGDDKGAILRQVQKGEFPAPRQVNGHVPPPLEAICLKAMALAPADRYPNPHALADDIEHWLADEPVSAHRDPLLARLGRWARGHRTMVAGLSAAALVAFVSLTAATILLSAANRREADARKLAQDRGDEAEHQSAKARANFQLARDAVEEYCTKVSNDPRLKEKDLEALRKELLESAIRFHQKFVDQHREDPNLRADLGRAYLDLSDLTGQSDYAQAVQLSRQATTIFAELIFQDPAEGSYYLDLSQALTNLGGIMDTHGQTKEARAAWEDALRTLESVRQQQGSSQRFRRLYMRACSRLAYMLYDKLGSEAEAIATFRKAIALVEDGQAPATELPDVFSTSELYTSLGQILGKSGKAPQEGLFWCEKGVQLLQPRLTRTYRPAALLHYLSSAYFSTAEALRYLSRYDSAVQYYRKAAELSEELVAAHPGVVNYQFELGACYNNLHGTQLLLGQGPQAMESLKKSVEVKERLAVRYPDVPDYQANLVRGLSNLAMQMIDLKQARSTQHRAEVFARELTRNHPSVTQYQTALATSIQAGAEVHLKANEWPEAIAACDEAIAVFEKLVQTSDVALNRRELANAYLQKSIMELRAGKPELAAEAGRKATALNPNDPTLFYGYGMALLDAGRLEDATLALGKAVALNPNFAMAHSNLGNALLRQGRFVEARAAFQRGHEIGSKQPGWNFPTAQLVKNADKMIQLDGRLTAILAGETQPNNAVEQLELALICQQFKRLNAAAARFYAGAFAIDPKLADDMKQQRRYNAACAAALAGCGKGKDVDKLNDPEKAKLRSQAIEWLKADLAHWTKLAGSANARERVVVTQTLTHWQQDADLAGVRGEDVAKWPDGEQAAWRKLWQDVEMVLVRARGG